MKALAAAMVVVIAIIGISVSTSPALASGSGAGITGSPHDFTDNSDSTGVGWAEIGAGGWNKREEICRVCHVPHDHNNAARYGDVGLLWNHAMSSATYTMYATDTHIQFIDGAADAQPTGTSKMCLGCHDGTVGVDQFDKYAGGVVFIDDYDAGYQVPGSVMGSDLSNTHPLAVVYDAAADGGLNPMTDNMGTSGTIADVLETGNKIACMSCHDVHDASGESVAGTHLLRVAQTAAQGGAASGLCLTCHNK